MKQTHSEKFRLSGISHRKIKKEERVSYEGAKKKSEQKLLKYHEMKSCIAPSLLVKKYDKKSLT